MNCNHRPALICIDTESQGASVYIGLDVTHPEIHEQRAAFSLKGGREYRWQLVQANLTVRSQICP